MLPVPDLCSPFQAHSVGAIRHHTTSPSAPPTLPNTDPHQSNLSLYTVTSLLILDVDGQRVLAKYYNPPHQAGSNTGVPADLGVGAGGPGMGGLATLKEQRAFEKSVVDKIRRGGGECGKGLVCGLRVCRC